VKYVEKYRPVVFSDLIGQTSALSIVKNVLSRQNVVHFMFVGSSGCGKTSMMECIARSRFGDEWRKHTKEFNASSKRGIDAVRDSIIPLLQLQEELIIFMDECDMTEEAQNALRRPLEKTKNATVIFSTNDESNIIEPILSRCIIIRFKNLSDADVSTIIVKVIKSEGITFDQNESKIRDGLEYLVKSSHGDLRAALNNLEKLVDEKKQITVQNLVSLEKLKVAADALKFAYDGHFKKAQEMIEDVYKNDGLTPALITQEWYYAIRNNEIIKDEDHQRELYKALSNCKYRCSVTSDPLDRLIHLVAFLTYAHKFPHLEKVCPAMVMKASS